MTEPSKDFKFRSGKYQGMTYEWVCERNYSYIEWVMENQPKMLKEIVTTKIDVKETPYVFGKITPNMAFENEGPEWYSLPHLEEQSKKV